MGAVEGYRRLVPVEHRPFQAPEILGNAAPGEMLEQRAAHSPAPRAGLDEQVLEEDPVPPDEGREAVEPKGEAHRLAIELRQIAKDPRSLAEQGGGKRGRGGHGLIEQLLVFGQAADELSDPLLVAGRGRSNAYRRRRRHGLRFAMIFSR